ncbi:finTRIM family, member 14 [Silurus asotus]|uniref:FinTRIM family, member 14 n=1 Tax=Silurus asotus TaxID=30991 RepID=A0AAD5B1F3_SILAS|nr:finTRIM family, member 14 [Silurus asotus]
MAAASISDQDQFNCPVCLELLKDPVTLHCGHSYCKVCINGFWDEKDQKKVYSCPQCRETFTPRPVLRRNNMLAEVVEKVKKNKLQAASAAHCYTGPGDVDCDSCTGRKRKATKSCLVCLASFCKDHLKPHYQAQAFKKHKLIEACVDLHEKICSQHDKLNEIYCRTDKSFICYLCTLDKHRGHDTVSTTAERTEKQNELKEEQLKSQQKVQEKQKKVKELKQTVDIIKTRSQAAVDDNEKIFNEMISSLVKRRSDVMELIRAQEKAELSRAEQNLKHLEQEITDLQRRISELEQLSHTPDHIHFLQNELKEEQLKSQQKVQEKQKKVQDLKQTVYIIKKRSQAADDNEKIFNEMISSMVKRCSEVKEMIRVQEKAELSRAEQHLKHLEQEITDLQRRVSDLEQLSHTPDHIHFLQNELKEEQLKSQQKVQEKQRKVQEVKQTVYIIKTRSQAAVDDNEEIFNEMISSLVKRRSEVKKMIRVREKAELSRAEQHLKHLEQEITDLQRRDSDLEQLSHTSDHIHFLQSFPSLCVSPGCDDSPSFTVNQHLSFDGVRKSVLDLKKRVEEICQEEFNKIHPQDFCYLTLDPNTAHPFLVLSEKNRAVMWSETKQQYSDHPERFDSLVQVLCKESVCGRRYWEVDWNSENWVYISVSYKEISRKGEGDESMFGRNSQSWSLQCSSSSVSFSHNSVKTELRGPAASKIGVYVDHSAGTLFFYSISKRLRLLHRVQTTFTQPLYAGFRIGFKSAVKFCELK